MYYSLARHSFRLIARQTPCAPIRRMPTRLIHTTRPTLAVSQDWQNRPKHPLIDKIEQHPHILQQLIDFTQLLQSKGVDVSGQQPSFMQMMKVMNDEEVKEKVKQLVQDMQAAGIQLDMNTIQELQASFIQPSTENESESRGRKRGVLNSVKGLFKK
ncbi:hypothetical protein EDC96DRAFT_446753 [Choanephora cucurbitarum]|nr:hypothetical protein EDC96DRAFT_446753 [Choanephora cucurbitarum]